MAKYRDNDVVKIVTEKPDEVKVYYESGKMGTKIFYVLKRKTAAGAP